MSDSNLSTPKASRRRGNQNAQHAGNGQQQQQQQPDDVQYHSGPGRANAPKTPAKTPNARRSGGQGQAQAAGDSRSTPDGHRRSGSNNSAQKHFHNNQHNQQHHGYDGSSDSQAPRRVSSATPAKPAYAGPTFHASPAASTLPMPTRFFSKSVPADQPAQSLQGRLNTESASQDRRPPSASSRETLDAQPVQVPPRQESPLDIFFNAQKAERSAQRTGSPLATSIRSGSPQQQPGSAHRQSRSTSRGTPSASKNAFMQELDGVAESGEEQPDVSSPVPFKQRMQVTRSTSSPGHIPTAEASEAERQAKTLELKKLLSLHPSSSEGDGRPGSSFASFASPSPTPPRGYSGGPQQNPTYSSPYNNFQQQQRPLSNGQQFQGYAGSPQRPRHPSQGHVPGGHAPAAELPAHVTSPQPSGVQPGNGHGGGGGGGGEGGGRGRGGGFHNQISSVRQMEDSLKKLLKLDDVGGGGGDK